VDIGKNEMQNGNLAFTDGTIIDGYLDHDVIQNGTILVRNVTDGEKACGTIEHGSDFDDETADLMLDNPKSLRGYTAVVPTFSPAQAIIDRAGEGIISMTEVQVENSKIILEGMVKGARACLDKGILMGVNQNPLIDLKALARPCMVCCMGRLIDSPAIREVKGVDFYRII
jgi:hypothetical protein